MQAMLESGVYGLKPHGALVPWVLAFTLVALPLLVALISATKKKPAKKQKSGKNTLSKGRKKSSSNK